MSSDDWFNRPRYYVLKDKQVVPAADVLEWGIFFENFENRRVAFTEFKEHAVVVSTVFLGIDHGWLEGPPIVFETMIFADNGDDAPQGAINALNETTSRYATYAEAEAGHAEAVALVKAVIAEKVAILKPRADDALAQARSIIEGVRDKKNGC